MKEPSGLLHLKPVHGQTFCLLFNLIAAKSPVFSD